jgi:hypothetical protein
MVISVYVFPGVTASIFHLNVLKHISKFCLKEFKLMSRQIEIHVSSQWQNKCNKILLYPRFLSCLVHLRFFSSEWRTSADFASPSWFTGAFHAYRFKERSSTHARRISFLTWFLLVEVDFDCHIGYNSSIWCFFPCLICCCRELVQ